jgi:HEAT repeat protein
MKSLLKMFCLSMLLVVSGAGAVLAQTGEDDADGTAPSVAAAKQLGSSDPLVRLRAAEDLAAIAATNQRRLLEGYRLQEKNARVRLALDWALYRVGKTSALFEIVRALDSSRAAQARAYLSTLATPEPLYLFLERANGVTRIELIRVFAKVGDAGTLDLLQRYFESPDPEISTAARNAAQEIEQRLSQQQPADTTTRPRQVGTGEDETPN